MQRTGGVDVADLAGVLAVDGGNSKTDLALLSATGELLASLRWETTSHQVLGLPDAMRSLREAVAHLAISAGDAAVPSAAAFGMFCLAGLDLPVDDRRVGVALANERLTRRHVLLNDTFSVLRAGTAGGWGVALVCGAGMNGVGAAPDGRQVRFPALGPISGDGPTGGGWLGIAALRVAVRATDGRGEPTTLSTAVPAHFGFDEPIEVTEAIYTAALSERRLVELAPAVFAAARAGDEVARGLLDDLADELVAVARAILHRLDLGPIAVPVVLGGGILRSGDDALLARIRRGILDAAPEADIRYLGSPPVLGAALLGLEAIGTPLDPATVQRLRQDLEDIPAR